MFLIPCFHFIFLAVVGLYCCTGHSLVAVNGYSSLCGLFTELPSLVVELGVRVSGLAACRLSSGAQA